MEYFLLSCMARGFTWIINEAVFSEFRLVFDASRTISCFSLNYPEHWSEQSGRGSSALEIENRSWEDSGNSHLGAIYASMFFHEINYTGLVKLLNCEGKYIFADITEDIVYPSVCHTGSQWTRMVLRSFYHGKNMDSAENVKSQNRILNCSLRDQLKSLGSLDFPFSLESLLSITADKNKTIVLAVAGYSYKDMLMSWVCRLRVLQVTNFIICALDHETYQFSVLQGLPVFHDPSAPRNISFDDCHFGTACFERVTKVKSRMVWKILKLGYNALLSDVDVYWFGNPLPLLYSFHPGVLVAQSDEYHDTAAMEKVEKHAATSNLSEQPSFYDTLCGEGGSYRISDNSCVEPETNLTVHFLDRNLFPNGACLNLLQKKNVKKTCMMKGCLVLHNNWISGRMKKLDRQIVSGPSRSTETEARRKIELEGGPISVDSCIQSRDICVRIVHPGGREELYQHAVPASQLMAKYPGICVAHPGVFKNPQESLIWPDEKLLPGHKYLIIPSTTAQKLTHKHTGSVKVKGFAQGKDEIIDVNITWDPRLDISEESVGSAREFYTSKDRWPRYKVKRTVKAKKPFVPPLPKARSFRGSGWEPSLNSVQEVSP